MAWKKLAFTDEMVTNPATADLDMADYAIIGMDDIKAFDSSGIIVRDLNNVDVLHIGMTAYGWQAQTTCDMNTEKIIGLQVGTSAADAIRKDQALLLDGTQAMAADINFAKHNADAMCIQPLASAPATPAMAQMYYNTTDDHLYVYAS